MPAGRYAVVRYVPDPARDEPINVGLIATGPAGATFKTDPAALDRMRIADPFLDAETIPHVQEYLERLVNEPAVRVRSREVQTVQPWEPEYLEALQDRCPERFALGRSLFVEYADESREAMEDAAADLVDRLVKPVMRKPRFPRDPGAPHEQLAKLLTGAIKRGLVKERPDIQGFTHRVRQPDFYYEDREGTTVLIITVKLSQRQRHVLSQTADAKAFELFDLIEQKRRQHVPMRTVAIVEQPETPTDPFFDAIKSIQAVADEIIDPREGVASFAARIERELAAV